MDEKIILPRILKIKLMLLVVISNAIVFLIMMAGDNTSCEELNRWINPKGYEQIKIQARLLTPFEAGKKVSIFDTKNQYLVDGFLASEQETLNNSMDSDLGETNFFVAIPKETIHLFNPNQPYHLYPEISSFKNPAKEDYEVTY